MSAPLTGLQRLQQPEELPLKLSVRQGLNDRTVAGPRNINASPSSVAAAEPSHSDSQSSWFAASFTSVERRAGARR